MVFAGCQCIVEAINLLNTDNSASFSGFKNDNSSVNNLNCIDFTNVTDDVTFNGTYPVMFLLKRNKPEVTTSFLLKNLNLTL